MTSVRAFLEGIIDYAGMFPPAELPLDLALANYLKYLQEPDSWMLGRFICPAARLGDLVGHVANLPKHGGPLRLSVLGRGGKDAVEFLANVKLDVAGIAELGGSAIAEIYEVKLPAGPELSVQAIGNLIASAADLIPNLSLFIESPSPAAMGNLAEALQSSQRPGRQPGWKLRCGGLQASAFPTPSLVARVLLACASRSIPWKATAGLHHPLRHFDSARQTPMHGFVNIFGAGVLLHAKKIAAGEMEEMLSDEDPGNFTFDQAGFSWKDHQVTTEQIRLARTSFVTSFGSCSFDEPRDDMRRLGWL